jgi:hypothetical protein
MIDYYYRYYYDSLALLKLVDLRTFDEVVWSATYPSETDV